MQDPSVEKLQEASFLKIMEQVVYKTHSLIVFKTLPKVLLRGRYNFLRIMGPLISDNAWYISTVCTTTVSGYQPEQHDLKFFF